MQHQPKPVKIPVDDDDDFDEVQKKSAYHTVTPKEYAAYRLMIRKEQTVKNFKGQEFCSAKFHLGRKLLQLYIVDCYIRAENQDLRWYKKNTKQLRVDKYKNLTTFLQQKAAAMSDELNENITPGNIFVVPSSHSVRFKFFKIFKNNFQVKINFKIFEIVWSKVHGSSFRRRLLNIGRS